MVTVSVAEEEGLMEELLQKMLKIRGRRVAGCMEESDAAYVFLPYLEEEKRDVVLMHKSIKSICRGEYVTILNADECIADYNKKSLIVTYGFNPLSTITASSIGAEGENVSFICCLQRSLPTLKGKILEPQEFLVNMPFCDVSKALGVVAAGLVLSLPPKAFCVFFNHND